LRGIKNKNRICVICGENYVATGIAQKTCGVVCSRRNKTIIARDRAIRLGLNKEGPKFGGVRCSTEHPNYKHGLGSIQNKWGMFIKTHRRYCERCNKDLIDATHYFWAIHHRDYNKYNNPEDGSNWELLCKRCHNIEHMHWKGKREIYQQVQFT
jgi:ribosomal protein S27AE